MNLVAIAVAVVVAVASYLCSRSCELWNNHSVSPGSLTPTGMGKLEKLWYEGSYEDIKREKQLLLELTISKSSLDVNLDVKPRRKVGQGLEESLRGKLLKNF